MGTLLVNSMGMFTLRWSDFEENFRDLFRRIGENKLLSDVTLATVDGGYIQAHKIILSLGSSFFKEIFLNRNNQYNMLIYLKGIRSSALEPILDFLYHGEVSIAQEEIKDFLELGKELEIKALEGEASE